MMDTATRGQIRNLMREGATTKELREHYPRVSYQTFSALRRTMPLTSKDGPAPTIEVSVLASEIIDLLRRYIAKAEHDLAGAKQALALLDDAKEK